MLSYVDDLLETVKKNFVEKFAALVLKDFHKMQSVPFDPVFNQINAVFESVSGTLCLVCCLGCLALDRKSPMTWNCLPPSGTNDVSTCFFSFFSLSLSFVVS